MKKIMIYFSISCRCRVPCQVLMLALCAIAKLQILATPLVNETFKVILQSCLMSTIVENG